MIHFEEPHLSGGALLVFCVDTIYYGDIISRLFMIESVFFSVL